VTDTRLPLYVDSLGRAPDLLMWGRHDRVVPLAVGRRLAEAMPGARLHVLDACGHLPLEELPDESFAVLQRFLENAAHDPSTEAAQYAGETRGVPELRAVCWDTPAE